MRHAALGVVQQPSTATDTHERNLVHPCTSEGSWIRNDVRAPCRQFASKINLLLCLPAGHMQTARLMLSGGQAPGDHQRQAPGLQPHGRGHSRIPFPAGRSGHARPESGRCRDGSARRASCLARTTSGSRASGGRGSSHSRAGRCCLLIRTCFIGNPSAWCGASTAVSSLPRRRRSPAITAGTAVRCPISLARLRTLHRLPSGPVPVRPAPGGRTGPAPGRCGQGWTGPLGPRSSRSDCVMRNVVVVVKTSMSAAASTPVYLAMTGAAARSVTVLRWALTPAQAFSP